MSSNMQNGILTVGLVQIFCKGTSFEHAEFLGRAAQHCFGLQSLPKDKITFLDETGLDGNLFELPEALHNVLPCLNEDTGGLINAKLCAKTAAAYAIYSFIPQTRCGDVRSLEVTFTLMLLDGCYHEAGSYWEDMPTASMRPDMSDTLAMLSDIASCVVCKHGPGDSFTARLQSA